MAEQAARSIELPAVSGWFVNHKKPRSDGDEELRLDPRPVHQTLPGYEPTPLTEAPSIAAAAALERVWVKDESSRFGLPSFKILGASYALYRALRERLRDEREWTSFTDWQRAADVVRPLTLVTATEGNHGRAVARLANRLGLQAHVLVPRAIAPARKDAIWAEGATVESIAGTYDDAVAALSGFDGGRYLVLSDTSWSGYEQIPKWVIMGYEAIFAEIDSQLLERHARPPDLIVVQAGVGALAAAATRAWPSPDGPRLPRVVAVEPEGAACVMSALRAGEPRQLPGPFESVMAGLNCGLASAVALPYLHRGLDGVVTIADAHVGPALRLMYENGISAGPTGAAGVAALLALLASDEQVRGALELTSIRDALVICTEGVTSPGEIDSILAR